MNVLETITRLQSQIGCGDITFAQVPPVIDPQSGSQIYPSSLAVVIMQRVPGEHPNLTTESRIVRSGTDYVEAFNRAVAMAEDFADSAVQPPAPANVTQLGS